MIVNLLIIQQLNVICLSGNGVLNKYVGGFFDAKQQQANYFACKAEEQVKQKKHEEEKRGVNSVVESRIQNSPS